MPVIYEAVLGRHERDGGQKRQGAWNVSGYRHCLVNYEQIKTSGLEEATRFVRAFAGFGLTTQGSIDFLEKHMRIVLAHSSFDIGIMSLNQVGMKDRLLSYCQFSKKPDFWLREYQEKGVFRVRDQDKKRPQIDLKVRLMLDSGAFTVWQKEKTIDIDDYIAFIKRNRKWIDTYFNLDVIPGTRGNPRTARDIEKAAAKSSENQRYMKDAGLAPIPVFHQQESFHWLNRMIKNDEPYIALSPFKELHANDQRKWLDECFTVLTDKRGRPFVKTHGLGVASLKLLFRYPWTSCDASSWVWVSRYGSVLIPPYKRGKPDYSQPPIKVHVSDQNKRDGQFPPHSYQLLSREFQKCVVDFLENHAGVSLAEVLHDYYPRDIAVMTYFMELSRAHTRATFDHRMSRLIRS